MKMRKTMVFALTGLLLFSLLTGCGIVEGPNQWGRIKEPEAPNISVSDDFSPIQNGHEQFSPLADTQAAEGAERKSLYDLIFEALDNNSAAISLYDVPEAEVTKAYEQIVYEHPEFFWADHGYSWTVTSGVGRTIIELKPKLAESMDTIADKRQQLDAAVDAILADIPAAATDYEKALYVHDYLVLNTEYDSAAYARIQASPDQSILDDADTAYGCIVNHLAVCDGYAKAFHLLMNRLGIEAGRVFGIADGESHAWNYIALDGDYYYVDVTWDDPVAVDGSAVENNIVSHEYFCITTDSLLLDHSITDNAFYVPNCTALAYEYFRYHGLFLESYSMAGVEDLIVNKSADDSVQIEFGSQSELQEAITQLFDHQEIFEIPYVQEHFTKVWRSVGHSGCVLTIRLYE